MLPAHLLMWQNLILYFGPLQHLESRVNGAPVLLIGLYRNFDLRVAGGPSIACRCAIVSAGTPHEVDAHGAVLAKLFVERDSSEYWAFLQRFPLQHGRPAIRLDDPALIAFFTRLYEDAPDKDTLRRELAGLLPVDPAHVTQVVAPRLAPVFDLIRRQGDENHGQAYAAELASLSASRMLHLFKTETGMTYRGYRIWKRLILAAEHLQQSDCMTRSALDAGFSDASHFSHCYKRFIGVSPSLVFRNLQRFER